MDRYFKKLKKEFTINSDLRVPINIKPVSTENKK